jgi:hypothetical protein
MTTFAGRSALYGDPYEVNGTVSTATPIDLTNTNLVVLNTVSLDRTADVDFYRLTVPARRKITITVTPIGSTYQVGGADGNPPQSTIDTRAIQNLQLELRDSSGATLASATSNGVGQAEQIANFVLYPAGGNFYVRVFSGTGSTDDVQRYELRLQTVTLPAGDIDGNGCVDDADLLTILFNFGGTDPRYDLNGDGVIDDADLLTRLVQLRQWVLKVWTTNPLFSNRTRRPLSPPLAGGEGYYGFCLMATETP